MNLTPSDSKRSHDFWTSSTEMAMWPKPVKLKCLVCSRQTQYFKLTFVLVFVTGVVALEVTSVGPKAIDLTRHTLKDESDSVPWLLLRLQLDPPHDL